MIKHNTIPKVVKSSVAQTVIKSNRINKILQSNNSTRVIKISRIYKVVSNDRGAELSISRFKYGQVPAETPNGVIVLFTLDEAYQANTLTVYRDQSALKPGTDFVETDPTAGTFTLTSAPYADENVWANFISAT